MIEFLDTNAMTISSITAIMGAIILLAPMIKEHVYRRWQRTLIQKGGKVGGLSSEEQGRLGDQIQRTSFLEHTGLWVVIGAVCLVLAAVFLVVGLT
jgi:hypothetical protein